MKSTTSSDVINVFKNTFYIIVIISHFKNINAQHIPGQPFKLGKSKQNQKYMMKKEEIRKLYNSDLTKDAKARAEMDSIVRIMVKDSITQYKNWYSNVFKITNINQDKKKGLLYSTSDSSLSFLVIDKVNLSIDTITVKYNNIRSIKMFNPKKKGYWSAMGASLGGIATMIVTVVFESGTQKWREHEGQFPPLPSPLTISLTPMASTLGFVRGSYRKKFHIGGDFVLFKSCKNQIYKQSYQHLF